MWYASTYPALEVLPELNLETTIEFNLQVELTLPDGTSLSTAEHSVRVVPQGEPVTAAAYDWTLRYDYRGEVTLRGSEALMADVSMLHPGDTLIAFPHGSPGIIKDDWANFPRTKISRQPFKVSKPTFKARK